MSLKLTYYILIPNKCIITLLCILSFKAFKKLFYLPLQSRICNTMPWPNLQKYIFFKINLVNYIKYNRFHILIII